MQKITVCLFVVLLSLTGYVVTGHAEDAYDTAPEEAGTFQGTIIEIVEHDLVVKKSDGEVVRVPMPGATRKRAADFQMGEVVEITLTPGGMTTSVIPLPGEFVP